ncbi:E3 ubiquitin-protein ligase UPL3 isoform X1 [Cryptomeria japonica]|uniref:E3 ubiquitin-protein ligase UPL3 isoform X1 n=2 Tax=Cryptomeria japonica TaxID=3369 RepID=UPI0027DA2FC8|nr:E3 ubiquitin-protein ligase UPL3 isoform X1 [Cryptomeria japonica]
MLLAGLHSFMETRSRKRAEATAKRPSSAQSSPCANKRARLSSSTFASSAASFPTSPRARLPIRSVSSPVIASFHPELTGIDLEMESSSSSARKRDHEDKEIEKGKEKERRGGYSDDNSDEDEGVGSPHHNVTTTASSALKGLLRKLGAGLDDLLPPPMPFSQQSSRLKRILSGLRAEGEVGRQIEALTQLCEMLSIATEDSLSSFSVDSFVPVLVALLNHEGDPDVMLLAARALTHLCEVLPQACASVVHYGAVPSFCARLLTIEYMDLAEQSLEALEKISHEHPAACLRAGGLMAVLSYLDFFSTGVQRVALSTAANICKKLPSDAADFLMEAVPILTNLLQYNDSKVVEHASICLTRIAESFASSSDKLDELCNHGLVAQAVRLVSVSNSGAGQTSLSAPTYTGLIRLLSTFAGGSALAAKTLFDLNISHILRDVLAASSFVSGISASPALNRPPDQTYEIVTLLNELLPPLAEGTISLPVSHTTDTKCSSRKNVLDNNAGKIDDMNETMAEMSAREKLLRDQPELLVHFGIDILPVLVQVYGSSVRSAVRHKCIAVISKLVYFSTSDMLTSLLRETNISSFLAGVLGSKDPYVLIPALQIADILIQKLPDTFSKMFVKEGVLHAVDTLISADMSGSVSAQAFTPGKDEISESALPNSTGTIMPLDESNSKAVGKEEYKGSNVGRCSSPSGEAMIPIIKSDMWATVGTHAKHFKDTYFPADSEIVDGGMTESLRKLKTICMKLNDELQGNDKVVEIVSTDEERMLLLVAEMLSELVKGDGVSTFEFVGSGVIPSLLNYFSYGALSKQNMTEAESTKVFRNALNRFKLFIRLTLPLNGEDGREAPLTILVHKLQNALSSLERFPVILSHSQRLRGGNASLSGLSALRQPVKLRLCRGEGETSLRDYSSNVVLIDSLANLAAVEEFLWPRVQRGEADLKTSSNLIPSDSCGAQAGTTDTSPTSSAPVSEERSVSNRHSGSSATKDLEGASASSSKGKEKAVSKCVIEETKAAKSRNNTRMRVSDGASQLSQHPSESVAEEEELDGSPAELDDSVPMEEEISEDEDDDYEGHLDERMLYGEEQPSSSVTERVHAVQLGDHMDESATMIATTVEIANASQPPSRVDSRSALFESREGSEFLRSASLFPRGSLSFARAAMSGLLSVGGRSARGSRGFRTLPMADPAMTPSRLDFFIGGKKVDRSLTIYQAIQRQAVADEDSTVSAHAPVEGRRLWDEVYSITYRIVTPPEEKTCAGVSGTSSSKSAEDSPTDSSSIKASLKETSFLGSILQGKLPCDLEKSNCTYDILLLLRVLEGLNRLAPRLRAEEASDAFAEGKITSFEELKVKGPTVPQNDFLSGKLTPKLARQMQDPLALCSGGLPSWCHQLTKACPFLFPFEIRRQYFHSASFGSLRALQHLQQQQSAENPNATNEQGLRVGRLQRQKVRVSRNRILDSAMKVMELYSSQNSVLEVEYFDEVGTGLGPTLEFYTLLSHELQKDALGMWRSSSCSIEVASGEDTEMQDVQQNEEFSLISEASEEPKVGNQEFVQAPRGLFPRPWPPNADSLCGKQFSKVIDNFRLLGRVMAKALQDRRLLDLPFSTAFYKLVLGQELDLFDIQSFDLELGTTLQEIQALVRRKQFMESLHTDKNSAHDLHFRNARIEDLCLDFTLPGYSDYVLKPGGNNIMVDLENLEEYLHLAADATIRTGVMPQMEAFRAGFNEVFPLTSLHIFSESELECLLCGGSDLWTAQSLFEHIKFDHGYTSSSPPIINLLEIIGEFTPEQKRAFLQFVTGAPRLPPGGLAALNPRLTIVRKHPTGTNGGSKGASTQAADGDLPSVMTCANYLKLPPYSSKEVMHDRLMYAITEGQGSFDLS